MKKTNLLDAAMRGTQASAANVKDRFNFSNAQDVIFAKPTQEPDAELQQPIIKKITEKPEKQIKAKGRPGRKSLEKTIRDIFSMPESDYNLVAKLVGRGGKMGMMINKSQIIRMGLLGLENLSDSQFENALRNFTKREMERMAASKKTESV